MKPYDQESWSLSGMTSDEPNITDKGLPIASPTIDGATVRYSVNVLTSYGYLCEIYRQDWGLDQQAIGQVFQASLDVGQITGWHVHAVTTDRLFVCQGRMRVVLYDSRRTSPTYQTVWPILAGSVRPAIIVVPPGVWHAVQNLDSRPGLLLNIVDHAYDYARPDHYRLPIDTDQIPYRFLSATPSVRETRAA